MKKWNCLTYTGCARWIGTFLLSFLCLVYAKKPNQTFLKAFSISLTDLAVLLIPTNADGIKKNALRYTSAKRPTSPTRMLRTRRTSSSKRSSRRRSTWTQASLSGGWRWTWGSPGPALGSTSSHTSVTIATKCAKGSSCPPEQRPPGLRRPRSSSAKWRKAEGTFWYFSQMRKFHPGSESEPPKW